VEARSTYNQRRYWSHIPSLNREVVKRVVALTLSGPPPGAPMGNQNAYKNGRHTKAIMADRRRLSGMLTTMKALAGIVSD
jgi:hypothetical protein